MPDFVQACGRRFYPVGRYLLIPFTPPLVYSVGGKLRLPWFIFWRTNPLVRMRLSLFATLVADMLGQDPDLEAATFETLDFSVPVKGGKRMLRVTNAVEILRLFEAEKNHLLTTFAEGFRLANEELAGASATNLRSRRARIHLTIIRTCSTGNVRLHVPGHIGCVGRREGKRNARP